VVIRREEEGSGVANRIEFVDLKRQYASIQGEVDAAMRAVVESAAFVGGPAMVAFEADFARYCETEHVISLANGTDALYLALRAIGVGAGDEVITVSHTFIATIAAIAQVGAQPVFADIDPDTYCLDPATLEGFITPRTKAIVPVHIYGQPCDMDPIMAVAERHGLFVLEDACQAHGARYKGRRAGGLGHLAAFSFYPGKNLGAYGDGGALTTNDAELAERVRLLRDHGRVGKYEHTAFGVNSRLDGLQAAVLGVKLRHLDRWNARRRAIAARYDERLAGLPGVTTPHEAAVAESVYHLYVIRTDRRAAVQAALNAEAIGNGIHYPIPVHRQSAWTARFGPVAPTPALALVERYASEILSLPMHPDLTDDEVDFVADVVTAAVRAEAASPVAAD
jgi:dTDP-4-amino-4,6-dideoxygalactose transaminase